MNGIPRVQRMVMFKHGVAYLERGGPADGPFELSFKREEMNDVLKSLAVWVARGDAKVGAVAFEKPDDPLEALAKRKMVLPEWDALAGVFAQLRGRKVAVQGSTSRQEGEVVGIDKVPDEGGRVRRSLMLRAANGRLVLVDLGDLQGVELLEAPSRADLEFLVDRSRAATAGENRSASVSLSGKAEDLCVSYVIPAPVWRVSYRLARADDTTVLMAWGIVHNPADEDLDDIDLTLTTGQPVSFAIDLYQPKLVERAVVEEETRAVAAPRRFERAPMAPAAMMAPAPMMARGGAPQGPPGFGAPPAPAAYGMAASEEEAPAADYADRGELFEYRLATKVSLKRGGSAMVPLFTSRVDAKKERIWRQGAGPSPDLVLTFQNGTGAVLEEGPAVIYDESVYAGEAMVPYSARGTSVKLAFAKDLAVRCKRASTPQQVMTGVRLGADALMEQSYREEHHELSAESDHGEEVSVIFELPKTHGRVLDPKGPQPFEDTASYNRFRLALPPGSRAKLVVVERWPDARRVEYRFLSGPQLEEWFRQRFLDRATLDALSGVRGAWEQARALDEQRARVEADLEATYKKQGKLSEQLAVLKEGGQEGALRLRYVQELGQAQDRVNACEAEIQSLRQASVKAQADATAMLNQLVRG